MKKITLFLFALVCSASMWGAGEVKIAGQNIDEAMMNVGIVDSLNSLEGVTATGTITYDPENRILTLNNATIECSTTNVVVFNNSQIPDFTIQLIGENRIAYTGSDYKSAIYMGNGLSSTFALTITGEGVLNLASTNWYGIHTANGGSVTISHTTLNVDVLSFYNSIGDNNNARVALVFDSANATLAGHVDRLGSITLTDCYLISPEDAEIVNNNGSYSINRSDYSVPIVISTEAPKEDPLATPLTLEAKEAGTQLVIQNNSSANFEYRLNGAGDWLNIAVSGKQTIDLAAIGDYVELKGHAATTCMNGQYSHVELTAGSAYIYGNIMSLVESGVPFAENLTLEGDSTFFRFFRDNPALTNHPTKALVLPATTLRPCCYSNMLRNTGLTQAPELPATEMADYCYDNMFRGCSALTQAPELPATVMKKYCYRSLFYECTNLTQAPALPATQLAEYCYSYMFLKSGLTQAPALPATEMADYCYFHMFDSCTALTQAPELPATSMEMFSYGFMFTNCSSLIEAPELPATTIARSCYSNMFNGCIALTKAPALPATEMDLYCYANMFTGCTALTESPVLPATNLASYCYNEMFSGCTNLSKVTCLATTYSDEYTTEWLKNVAENGTFVKEPNFQGWKLDSPNGIPAGWKICEYTPTGIDQTSQEHGVKSQKRIIDGMLYIQKGNKLYNALGTQVK